MNVAIILICLALAVVTFALWQRQRRSRREAHIRHFTLPIGLFDKLRAQHPHLSLKDCQLVAQGLRQFFLVYLKGGRNHVAMPSQVVDDLWHEFILYTKNYQQFCRRAFGHFLHHTPAAVMSKNQRGNAGIRRTWMYACHDENINPAHPSRLPLLFALDGKLNIPNGFEYVPDCSGFQRKNGNATDGGATVYCASDLDSHRSGCGGGTSSGKDGVDSDGGAGDGGGGDSGCGGGGCGGGGD